jgi:hypothetical protein
METQERSYITISLTSKVSGGKKLTEVEVEFTTVFYSRHHESDDWNRESRESFTQTIDPLPFGREWYQIISGAKERDTEQIMDALRSYLHKAPGRVTHPEKYIQLTQVCRRLDYDAKASTESQLRLVFSVPLTAQEQESWDCVPEEKTASV